jgi:Tannase and feruloyl esterase
MRTTVNLARLVGLSATSLVMSGNLAAQEAVCGASIQAGFKPDDLTTVLLVKEFKKGEALLLSGTAVATTPTAANDLCLVKINVGPGSPGAQGSPSTSPGIGIEVWLPKKENWNRRIHVKGGGGWVGGPHGTLTALQVTSGTAGNAPDVAGKEGAVSATTDTGHALASGSFAMNPDGSINDALWKDFAERGVYEMTVKTKALTRFYYGEPAKYTYWNGFSTGGRQGLKAAQANPELFDGILAGAPANNWTKFITTELYPQIVVQRELSGVALTVEQHSTVGAAAIAACGTVGGINLGYVLDPLVCRYDPSQDKGVLCTQAGGTNSTSGCVSMAQAQSFNTFWYGQTSDGSAPSPASDNSSGTSTAKGQFWYGLTRGTSLAALAGPNPFFIATDMVALELENSALATPGFLNEKTSGANAWKMLSYVQLGQAWAQGVSLQSRFANINTDQADLSRFKARGGKLLSYHGLADILIPPQGTINYYHRVAEVMGGVTALQDFYRLYMVPGMSHSFSNGAAMPAAVPLPNIDLLYGMLTDWVEKGIAPTVQVELTSAVSAAFPAMVSRPICLYPLKPVYRRGDPRVSASYACS